jgi:hypothetical protein
MPEVRLRTVTRIAALGRATVPQCDLPHAPRYRSWPGASPRGRQAMTLQKAKSIARHFGLTLGHYRVNFRDGDDTTAYYTDDLEDAVNTAVEMARKRPSA